MKYVLNYRDRPSGSPAGYEGTQERVLSLFQKWKMPASLVIHQFVTRLGEFGGYIVLETDNPADIHLLTTVFAVFECKVEPVLDVAQSVAVELQAIQWRQANSA